MKTIISQYHKRLSDDLVSLQSLIKYILRDSVLSMKDRDFKELTSKLNNTEKVVELLKADIKKLQAEEEKKEKQAKAAEEKKVKELKRK